MEVSVGFLFIIVFVLLPGLLFRRLYFYGEFSKQFYSCYGLPRLLAVSAIPGVIICSLSACVYHRVFVPIDMAVLVNGYKDLVNPNALIPLSNDWPVSTFNTTVFYPFCKFALFEILIAFGAGALIGRAVRFFGLDTRFKLLRFENYWFYAFSAQCENFSKFRSLRNKNKQHIMTKADILVNHASGTALYSGIVVDYELKEQESSTLSKVYLREAKRYKVIEGNNSQVDIAGQMLIVDCKDMININLTYIYEGRRTYLESIYPKATDLGFSIVYILLVLLFTFKMSWLKADWYDDLMKFGWGMKIVTYFTVIQFISLLNPFIKKDDAYLWFYKDWKLFRGKILAALTLGLCFWLLL
jgi:hypothetical protein